MLFYKIVYIFLCLLSLKANLLEAQTCKKCEIRSFNTINLQPCVCPANQYCTDFSQTCDKCDECYDFWNERLIDKENDTKQILLQLIKKYETNIDDVKKRLYLLKNKTRMNENNVKKLASDLDNQKGKISKIENDINNLEKALKTLEDRLKLIAGFGSIDVSYLNNIKENMTILRDQLKTLEINPEDFPNLEQLINRSEKINAGVKNLTGRLPKIKEPFLDLVLILDQDIDLLEEVLAQFTGKAIKTNTTWIEPELVWLFDLLNNYLNTSLDIDVLYKNASAIRLNATNINSSLSEILKRHEAFQKDLDKLKAERDFYKEIDDLRNRLHTFMEVLKNFEELQKILMKHELLLNQLEQFNEELRKFNKKVESEECKKNVEDLEKVWNESSKLMREYDRLQDAVKKPVDEVIGEINAMVKEIRQISKQLEIHYYTIKRKQT